MSEIPYQSIYRNKREVPAKLGLSPLVWDARRHLCGNYTDADPWGVGHSLRTCAEFCAHEARQGRDLPGTLLSGAARQRLPGAASGPGRRDGRTRQ